MGRFTSNQTEEQHLVMIQKQIFESGLSIKITMNDGSTYKGLIRSENWGNDFNGKNINNMRYYGEITIQDEDGDITTLDVLDIKTIRKLS